MFLFKILAILDFLIGLALILSPFHLISFRLVLGAALFLWLKAYLFKGDFLSIVDGIIGIYVFISFFGVLTWLSFILGSYLLIKAFYSFVVSF